MRMEKTLGRRSIQILINRGQDDDDLAQDVAYEDEGNEYEVNFEDSENSFGMDDGDDDNGPVF